MVDVPLTEAGSRLRRHVPALGRLESPVTTYYVLLGATLSLLAIGLVMVLSASAVTSLQASGSSFTIFRSQLLFAAIGLPMMAVASRLPVHVWRRLGWVLLSVALLGQALVFTPLGVSVNGNRNWIELGGQRLQPSEGMKLALVLWGAAVLSRKRNLLHQSMHAVVPLLFPVGVVALGLVLAGHDLGTTLILLLILGGLLFSAGAPARMFLSAGAAMALLVAALVVTSPNRMERVASWLGGTCTDTLNTCFQSVHGKYALADGGWWGVGLGASREKWSWLPEAHNDFIFAIIGEELGLPGTLMVLALFLALGYACYRMVTRTDDLFVRLATAAAMALLVAALVVTSPNRMERVASWLGGTCTDTLNTCFQSVHGKYALADGGWWGVGLGASREKWSWLPEAHNDFIFAIIGEELGLPGTLMVLALFLALGYACYRMVTRTDDLFVRLATAASMAWLVGQMLVNVGAVIGMLPVIGVPLPLVSSGGSALIISLVVLGMLMSFARAEPGAGEALTARAGLVRRSLAVLPGASRTRRRPVGGDGAGSSGAGGSAT